MCTGASQHIHIFLYERMVFMGSFHETLTLMNLEPLIYTYYTYTEHLYIIILLYYGMVEGKVTLGVYISEDLDRKFREFLAIKYKEIRRGLISSEVEQALSYWIALHTSAQGDEGIATPNPLSRVSVPYMDVKRCLEGMGFVDLAPGATIARRLLIEAIKQTRGSDPRTIKKWLKTFHESGLVRPLNASVWELVA